MLFASVEFCQSFFRPRMVMYFFCNFNNIRDLRKKYELVFYRLLVLLSFQLLTSIGYSEMVFKTCKRHGFSTAVNFKYKEILCTIVSSLLTCARSWSNTKQFHSCTNSDFNLFYNPSYSQTGIFTHQLVELLNVEIIGRSRKPPS